MSSEQATPPLPLEGGGAGEGVSPQASSAPSSPHPPAPSPSRGGGEGPHTDDSLGAERVSYAKRRLPFDEAAPARHPGVTAAAVLYGAAMLIAFGVAIFMATAQGHAFASVPVLASIAIGIWFFVRMLMTLRTPRAPRE